jgi:hypothetical protein
MVQSVMEEYQRPKEAILKLVRMGDRCVAVGNFNTLMQVSLALQNPTVEQLMDLLVLPRRERLALDSLLTLTSPARNFAQLRKVTDDCLVPFFGLYQSDMAMAKESIKSDDDDAEKQWLKYQAIAKIIRRFRNQQAKVIDSQWSACQGDVLLREEVKQRTMATGHAT